MTDRIRRLLIALAILAGVYQTPPALLADPLDSWTSQNSGTTNSLYGVTFAIGKFVAVGAPGTVLSSPDGVSWSSHNPVNTNAGAGVIFDGTKYVVCGFDGTILTSPDLVSWARQATGTTNLLREVIYSSGTFFAVGKLGTILTSANATNWISRASGTVNDLNSVAYGNDLFVVVGFGGFILTSPDGAIWTSRTSGTSYDLTQVIFANGTFVVSGDGGTIRTSPNGIAWTGQNSGTTHELSGVTYANGIFAAVGSAGGNNQTIDTSPDATNWTLRLEASNAQPLYRAAYGNGTFVAVGGNGTILQSGQVGPANQNIFPIATNAALVEFCGGIAGGGSNYLAGILSGTSACVQLVSTNGSRVGSLIVVGHGQGTASFINSDTAHLFVPQPVFGGTNYLVVWYDTLATEAYGQIISRSGVRQGSAFLLSSTTNKVPVAATSDGTNFLVVLENYDRSFYGRFVTGGGTLSGNEFLISSQQQNGKSAAAAFGKSNYLVVWQSNNGNIGNTNLTFGAFVSQGGSVSGPIQIGQTSSVDQNPLATAFDGTNYLVVWNWHSGAETQETVTNWELFGRLISSAGDFPGNELQLVTDPGDDVIPALAFGGSDYLLAWGYGFGVSTNTNVRFQFLDRRAGPVGSEFSVFTPQSAHTPLFAFDGLLFDGTRFVTAATLGSSDLSSGEVFGAFITPVVTPYQIYGYVMDNLSNPVDGVDVSASNSVGNVYSGLTDGTGFYSIDVGNGTWDVSVGCGELTSLGYGCANDQNAIVSDGSVEKDFTVQLAPTGTDQFTYETNNDTITIDGYDGTNLDVTIPSTITGLPVTSIGDYAFPGDTAANVTIPNSVTSIGDGAFEDCPALTSITIPKSVTNIGVGAFSDCTSLIAINVTAGNPDYTSVAGVLFNLSQTTLIQYPAGDGAISYTIPNTVTSIEDDAFYGSFSLASVAIPDSVTNFGELAFAFCSSLASVTIPNTVTSIGDQAFFGCDSLASVTIPASVTSIEFGPFADCASLAAINVNASNPAYISVAGVLFDHNETTLIQYPAGNSATTYNIPNSVAGIGVEAFSFCTSLASVTLPASVTGIGVSAFAYCYSLTGLYFEGNAPSADPSAFDGDSATAYYLLGATGWSSTFDGLPTAVWGVAPGAPRLTFLHSGTNAILTWPTNETGFTLQSTTNLVSPANWTNVVPASVVVNGLNTVTNPISGMQQFFRLSNP